MSATRANPFEDLSDFEPKTKSVEKSQKLSPDQIEQISRDQGFPSRQPSRLPAEPVRRQQRRHTTGRNVQIPIKGTAETRAQLEALADELQEPFGEILALALAALRRELNAKKDTL